MLSLPALGLILGYSYTKRVTSLSHFVLGAALGLAPLGAYLAVTGAFGPATAGIIFLAAAVMFWTAGFDVLYACQDVAHDRETGLHSIPAAVGIPAALGVARGCHALVLVLLLLAARALALGGVFTIGVAVTGALLAIEHRLVSPDDLSKVPAAFFQINVLISFVVMAAVLLDLGSHEGMKALEFLKKPGGFESVRVAVVSGAEEYLRAQVVARLLEGFGPEVSRDVIAGPPAREVGRFDFAGLLDTLRTPSLFGGESVIVLTDADALLAEHSAAFARFLERGETCHRLLVEGNALCAKSAAKSSAKKESLQAAVETAGGIVVFCDPLYDTPFAGRGPAWQTELTRFLADQARARGKDLSLEDAYEIQQLVGSNLRELVGEIDKLVTFIGARKRIEMTDIEEAVGATRTSPAFRLAESIASADLKESLRLSAELFERGAGEQSGGRRVTDDGGIAMMLIGATAQKLRRVGTALDLMPGAPRSRRRPAA